MKVLYITYENVFRTGILQAMVITPLNILNQRYNIDFTITSILKEAENDAIYVSNKEETQNKYPSLNIHEFNKRLTPKQSVLTFFKDIFPIVRFSIKEARRHDVIHCRGYGGAFIGLIASSITKTPFIFDMRGTLPEETVEVGKISFTSLKFRLLKRVERLLIRKAAAVFTVSEKFKDYIQKDFGKENTYNINNPTDFNVYSNKKEGFDRINFIYSGSMQIWHVPELTVKYFSRIYEKLGEKVYLIFCTNDIEKAEQLFRDYKLPETAYELNSVPYKEMPQKYKRAHMAFCFIKNSFSKSICFPVKFSEYIASELFILANDNIGDLKDIIEEYNCGISFQDLNALDSNLEKIIEITEQIYSSRNIAYKRDDLSFLNWSESGVQTIYNAYKMLVP